MTQCGKKIKTEKSSDNDLNKVIEKNKQIKDNDSEKIFESVFNKYISKKGYEFAIKTNQLIFCEKNNKPKGYSYPDFLLSINDQQIVAEVTTAHDFDDPGAKDACHPGITKFVSGGITGKISARIYDKMRYKTFKHVEDFHLPIIFVVFNNQQSSFIDETQIDYFLNDYRKYPQDIKDKLSLDKDYWVIEKIPRYHLISGILFIESNHTGLRIKYFPSENNKISDNLIKQLENPSKEFHIS